MCVCGAHFEFTHEFSAHPPPLQHCAAPDAWPIEEDLQFVSQSSLVAANWRDNAAPDLGSTHFSLLSILTLILPFSLTALVFSVFWLLQEILWPIYILSPPILLTGRRC